MPEGASVWWSIAAGVAGAAAGDQIGAAIEDHGEQPSVPMAFPSIPRGPPMSVGNVDPLLDPEGPMLLQPGAPRSPPLPGPVLGDVPAGTTGEAQSLEAAQKFVQDFGISPGPAADAVAKSAEPAFRSELGPIRPRGIYVPQVGPYNPVYRLQPNGDFRLDPPPHPGLDAFHATLWEIGPTIYGLVLGGIALRTGIAGFEVGARLLSGVSTFEALRGLARGEATVLDVALSMSGLPRGPVGVTGTLADLLHRIAKRR